MTVKLILDRRCMGISGTPLQLESLLQIIEIFDVTFVFICRVTDALFNEV